MPSDVPPGSKLGPEHTAVIAVDGDVYRLTVRRSTDPLAGVVDYLTVTADGYTAGHIRFVRKLDV